MEVIIQMLKHIIYTMALILGLAVLVTAFGCGRHERDHHDHQASECTVAKSEGQTIITCPDGSTATVSDGAPGPNGVGGNTGPRGYSGQMGPQGYAGFPGPAGAPGVDGRDGSDGASITPVLPCPSLSSPFPEELFCIADTLYAVYDANSAQVHLSSIPPGNYVTTDGRACHFTVIAGCEIQ